MTTLVDLFKQSEIKLNVVFDPPVEGEKPRTMLQYRAKLLHKGVVIHQGTYSMGSGHAPAYKKSIAYYKATPWVDRDNAIRYELQNGRTYDTNKPIRPDPEDVLACFMLDASIGDECEDFEEFFDNFCGEAKKGDELRKQRKAHEACRDMSRILRRHLRNYDKALEISRER